MRRIELMAPAGSREAFLGAINAGADAVYLGGKKFGARAFAANFEAHEMPDLVRYAHLRGTSVYVTINTLVFDDEVDELIRYTDDLVKADVDALIIQDLGMLDLLHRRYPNMPIHASTQTNAHNPLQVGFLKELGASRVILARETPIETIRLIKETVDIEVEVFVHGALCVSYSGNCLFSSMVGHRSGNRGECGQPCRLPYTLLKDGEPLSDPAYLMSTKDLMTLARLEELIASGVDALKIEGRMRKPEYVIQTVLSYRKALDAAMAGRPYDPEEEIDKLKRVFNRDYTDGYVLNAQPYTLNNAYRPNHMGIEVGTVEAFSRGKVTIRLKNSLAVNDGIRFLGEKDSGNVVSRIMTAEGLVTTAESGQTIVLDSAEEVVPGSIVMKTLDHGLVQKLEEFIDPNLPMIPLRGKAEIIVGKAMKLQISDDQDHEIEVVSDFVVPLANSVPMGREALKTSLEKLGNTPFYWDSLVVDCDGKGFVPVKIINELRRSGVENITALRSDSRKSPVILDIEEPGLNLKEQPFELIAKVRTQDQLKACLEAGIQTIYVEDSMDEALPFADTVNLWSVKRRIWPNVEKFKISMNSVINETGALCDFRNSESNTNGYRLKGDQFLNVTNVYTAALLFRKGLEALTLSLELQKDRIQNFFDRFKAKYGAVPILEQIVYGRTELMLSKYCPIAKTVGFQRTHCHLCEHNQYALKDRMDYLFPLLDDGDCNIRLLNSKPLCLIDHLDFFKEIGMAKVRLDFTIESANETADIVEAFQRALRKEPYVLARRGMTYGRFQN